MVPAAAVEPTLAALVPLLDAGAEFLWMGLNTDTGGSPVPQPSAFWWGMPDGRRIFVWNSISYPRNDRSDTY